MFHFSGTQGHIQQVRNTFMSEGDIIYCCEDIKCEGHQSVTNAIGTGYKNVFLVTSRQSTLY